MEARLHDYKRDAMLAFVRANKLNRVITSGGRNPKIGVITTGKSYLDVRQALDELGIDEVKCNDFGLRIYKIACPWPISRQELKDFAARPRPHHRGRGEALADRGAGARGALRHRQPAGLHRQEGRAGQLAVPGQGRARSQRRRDLHRRAAAEIRHRREPRRPRRAAEGGAARARRDRRTSRCASRISAPAARTIPRPWCRRARAPMPASAATTWRSGWTARRSGFTQMGGEGANWIGEAPFSKRAARVPEHRRRHLQPFRLHGDPRRDRLRRQHHLQDSVQRRRRHDRRPDERRRPHRAADRARRSRPKAPSASSSSATSRRNIRPAPNGRRASPSIIATTCRRCRRSCARSPAARC